MRACNHRWSLHIELVLWAVAAVARAADPVYVQDPTRAPDRSISQTERVETFAKMDAYARAGHLPVLRDGDPDELRLWITVALFDKGTDRYIFSADHASKCVVKGNVVSGPPSSSYRGHCKSDRRLFSHHKPLSELSALAELDGRSLACGVLDGYWIEIEGVSGGHRFALYSDNPSECSDDGSKLVAKLSSNL
jgi:hypothetical protein